MKRFVKLLAVSLLSISLVACGGSGTASTKTASDVPGTARDGNELKIETASMNLVKAQQEAGYELIDTEGLKAMIDKKEDVLIIDTMPASHFAKKRIDGAVNVELPVKLDEVKPEQKEALLKALGDNKDKKIVMYCGFVQCARSHTGAVIAKQEGYKNILRYPGGIYAWIDAGYPTVGDK